MKIIIGSDLVPTQESESLFIAGKVEKLFTDVLQFMRNADATIINLECAFTETENAIKKFGPNLKASPKCINGLKKAGITHVALANNHVFDFGCDGLVDTIKALEISNLPYTGVGENEQDCRKPYYIEHKDKKIAFINVCEHEYSYATKNRMGANPFDPFLTMQDIREAKGKADFVIVLYHGGKEHCSYPSPRLRNLAHEMAYCGADVVIAQHSHCIGCYELFEGHHILYGQGNFHFAKNFEVDDEEKWYTSLLVELEIEEDIKIRFYPLVLDKNTCSLSLMKGVDAERIMRCFYARNEQLKNSEWKKGWHEFCLTHKEAYEQAVKAYGKDETDEWAREWFCHYLDCEAHTDVWRELFPTWNMTNEK